MKHHDDRYDLVHTAVSLENGYQAVEAVTPTGDRTLWLMAPLCRSCEETTQHGDASARSAPHDQEGQLPARFRPKPPRCGRPRSNGKPCRQWVDAEGDACTWHAGATHD